MSEQFFLLLMDALECDNLVKIYQMEQLRACTRMSKTRFVGMIALQRWGMLKYV